MGRELYGVSMGKGLIFLQSDSSSQSDDSSEADQEDNEPNDEKDKEADDQTTTTHANGINSVQKATFQRIAEAIRKDSWYDLEVADKITLLKQMCEAALQTDVIRYLPLFLSFSLLRRSFFFSFALFCFLLTFINTIIIL